MTASPSVDNYFVGKGIVKFKPTGDAEYRDVGNAPTFELTPNITKLDHFSSREGVRSKDQSVVSTKELTLHLVIDELSVDNLQMVLMGSVDTAGTTINIMDQDEITGAVRLIGTNSIGSKVQIDLPNVSFVPSGAIGFITEGYATLEFDGDVTSDQDGSFGTCIYGITDEVDS